MTRGDTMRGWIRGMILGLLLAAVEARGVVVMGPGSPGVTIPMADGALASIQLTALPDVLYSGGFVPIRVRIENRAAQPRTWRIEFTQGLGLVMGNSRAALESEFSFTAPATTTQETVVLVPVATFPGAGGGMVLRGVIDGPDIGTDSFTIPFGGAGRMPSVRAIATPDIQMALQKVAEADRQEQARLSAARSTRYRPGRPPPVSWTPLQGAITADPAQWPADWRTWSQFNVMLMSLDKWEALDPARQHAVRQWVTLGGRLMVFPKGEQVRHEESLGFGSIVTAAAPIEGTNPGELRQFVSSGSMTGAIAGWRAPPLVESRDPLLDLRIGGRWLVGFLIGFAVLIGPVNLFYFAPVGRRHRLFLTVPLFSLLGTIVLSAVVLASDGWGGRGYRQALVILLPSQNEAAIFQRQVARTGMILRQSFALPADTELNLLGDGSGPRGVSLSRRGDRADGDWFASRAIQNHDLRRITPTRSRVDLVEGGRDGRAPVLQSSVGADLKAVWYRDEEGHLWKTGELPPGRRVTLEPAGGKGPDNGPLPVLAPGWFHAEGGPGELAPLPTLASIRWTDRSIHYAGRVEGAAK